MYLVRGPVPSISSLYTNTNFPVFIVYSLVPKAMIELRCVITVFVKLSRITAIANTLQPLPKYFRYCSFISKTKEIHAHKVKIYD